MKVLVDSPCSASVINLYGIKSWHIWKFERSKFEWHYEDKEICLVIEGQTTLSKQKVDIYEIKA